jgi:hypothetical protein
MFAFYLRVIGSELVQDRDYPDCSISVFLQSLQTNVGKVIQSGSPTISSIFNINMYNIL